MFENREPFPTAYDCHQGCHANAESRRVKLMIEILTLIGVHFRLVRSYIYTPVDAIYEIKYGLD